MAISTYAELQTAVGTWLNRSDLTSQIPDFITLAEAKFKRDLAGGTTITALSSGVNWLFTAHPDAYLYGALMEAAPYLHDDARVVVWKGLLAEAIEGVRRTRTSTAYDLTTYAGLQTAIKGWLDRFDIDAVALIVLAEARLKRALAGAPTITALSAGVNWLFSSHPDVYLYAALVEAEPYLKNDARIPIWKAQLEERIAEVLRSRTATAYTLTTYAGLQTAIKGWLDRTDVDATALITLAEARLKRDPRVRRLENHGAFAVDAESETLPTDFHSLEALYHNGSSYYGPIDIIGADQLGTVRGQYGGEAGAPRCAAVVEGSLVFAPVPDATYTLRMVYWQTITALSAGANWLATNHPDIYLYASLVEGAPYVKDPSQIPVWESKLETAIESLHRSNEQTRFGGGTLRRQIRAMGG